MSNLSMIPTLLVLLMPFAWLPPAAAQEAEALVAQEAEALVAQEAEALVAQEAESLLDRARAQYDQGEYTGAESTLRSLLAAQPGSSAALLWLSRALDRQERYDEAERAAKEALEIDSASPEILIQLARVYMLKDKKKDAREVLDEAEKLAPDMADIYYYRGRTYGKLRMALFRPRTAEREYRIQDASYRRAIALDPSHPDAFFQLGYAIEEIRDDPESAMEWYVRQASVNPAHDDAVHRLAACAVELKEYQKGYAQLQQVAAAQDSAVNPLVEGLAAQLEAYRYHCPGPAHARVPGHEAIHRGADGNRPR